MLYLLNSSILTTFGTFYYQKIEIDDVIFLLQNIPSENITSAIGHQATAEVLSEKLGQPISVNRIAVQMEKGDKAIVFKLKKRLEETKALTKEEMQGLECELGLLERLE